MGSVGPSSMQDLLSNSLASTSRGGGGGAMGRGGAPETVIDLTDDDGIEILGETPGEELFVIQRFKKESRVHFPRIYIFTLYLSFSSHVVLCV